MRMRSHANGSSMFKPDAVACKIQFIQDLTRQLQAANRRLEGQDHKESSSSEQDSANLLSGEPSDAEGPQVPKSPVIEVQVIF